MFFAESGLSETLLGPGYTLSSLVNKRVDQPPEYRASPDFFGGPIGLYEIWRLAKTNHPYIVPLQIFVGLFKSGYLQYEPGIYGQIYPFA